jgi:hypothetical protein
MAIMIIIVITVVIYNIMIIIICFISGKRRLYACLTKNCRHILVAMFLQCFQLYQLTVPVHAISCSSATTSVPEYVHDSSGDSLPAANLLNSMVFEEQHARPILLFPASAQLLANLERNRSLKLEMVPGNIAKVAPVTQQSLIGKLRHHSDPEPVEPALSLELLASLALASAIGQCQQPTQSFLADLCQNGSVVSLDETRDSLPISSAATDTSASISRMVNFESVPSRASPRSRSKPAMNQQISPSVRVELFSASQDSGNAEMQSLRRSLKGKSNRTVLKTAIEQLKSASVKNIVDHSSSPLEQSAYFEGSVELLAKPQSGDSIISWLTGEYRLQ